MKNQKKNILGALALVLAPMAAYAADGQLVPGIENSFILLLLLATTFALLLIIFIVLAAITYSLLGQKAKVAAVQEEESTPFWAWFWNKFNAAVPMSKEQDVLLHHNYDGIQELDNELPPWWKYGFYITIAVAIMYMFIYHGGNEQYDVSIQELYAENEVADIKKAAYLARMENLIDESNVERLADNSDLGIGKEIYLANCRTCHGGAGEGGVGPNLTDPYWIHGGGILNIFKTVKYGVPEKSMLAWKEKLTPKQMQQVSSYIMTFQGTKPANGKEPQGALYEEKPATGQTGS